jgi:hypothetical protein
MTGPYAAAQLWKLDLYPGFGDEVLAYLHDPTPYMPPSRLYWTRRLNRPAMDAEDNERVFDVQVLRGELIRFGDTQVQYLWRHHEDALPRAVRGPVSAAPRHAWCMAILNTNQDGDFWEQWRQRYRSEWPFVGTTIHPQLRKYSVAYNFFVQVWLNQERCYVGTSFMEEISQRINRNILSNAQRDRALNRLRQMARERNLSFAWAI